MNFGTKLRTVLRIVVSLNTAVYAVSAAVMDVGCKPLTLVWTGLTIASDFAVAAVTTYYNNDYTDAACRATGMMRLEKAAYQMDELNGEDFFDEPDDLEEFEDEDADFEDGEE